MKKYSLIALLAIGVVFAFTNTAYAAFLNKAEAEKLLSGNTFEGKDFKFKREVKVYLDPSGSYKRVDNLNNKEAGAWSIESDGKFCMKHAKSENCRNIQPGKMEGVYLLIKDGRRSLRIHKIVPGNPYNL
jgi:hypothetical protein